MERGVRLGTPRAVRWGTLRRPGAQAGSLLASLTCMSWTWMDGNQCVLGVTEALTLNPKQWVFESQKPPGPGRLG